MEKKTIGRFISALRKANGMTQKELGEKLFVSDKTVSRWERDECMPELSLIPSIAELFGITTDELLRGERNNPNILENSEYIERQKAKSDKQFKLMIHNQQKKYKNFTLISVGVTILGLLVATITNLTFSEGLLAFCLATAFFVASEICQICFAVNARLIEDEDDVLYNNKIKDANSKVIKTVVVVSVINIAMFAFCLPIVILIYDAKSGLDYQNWLGFGLLFVALALVVIYIVYILFVSRILQKKGLIIFNKEKAQCSTLNFILLKKTLVISLSIALILGIGYIILDNIGINGLAEKVTFDNCNDFENFIVREYDDKQEYLNQLYYDYNYNYESHLVVISADEKIVFEDSYTPDSLEDIMDSLNGNLPVKVITYQAHYDAWVTFNNVEDVFCFLLIFDFILAAVFYNIKIIKIYYFKNSKTSKHS